LEGANCASIMLVRGAPTFNSHWLAHAINSAVGRFQVGLVQYGAAQEQFNISHALDFWFAVPPIDEQCELVEQIVTDTTRLNNVRLATERTVALLTERRSALIAAAVTGQIKAHEA
jgi:type I restriction enzyme S subunit